jgi:hypothetical protein
LYAGEVITMARTVLFVVALTLGLGPSTGCEGPAVPVPEAPQPPAEEKKPAFRLDDSINLSLADLLRRPRKELAELARELTDHIRIQERSLQTGALAFTFLPDFRAPQAIPVFRQAEYSPARKLSLPPYLNEQQTDSQVALHLARFGDVEGALQLVDRSDTATVARIRALRGKRNYPLEWTRLVGLHLHAAEIRLATGDEEGARLLVGLHKELRKVLDSKARAGLLGATLLPRGRRMLAEAALAWRETKHEDLADQARAAVAAWGKVPPVSWPLPQGSPREDVSRLLGAAAQGHAVAATHPARAFDLLALPFPDRDVDGVIACLDAQDRLAELVVTYRPSAAETFVRPGQLGHLFAEWLTPIPERPSDAKPLQQSFTVGDVTAELILVPGNTAAGALVRLRARRSPANSPVLARQFGVVDLDRSFEHNRTRFALDQRGPELSVEGRQVVERVGNPLPALQAKRATLTDCKGGDVVSHLTFAFAEDPRDLPSLAALALPLWAAAGPAQRVNLLGDGSNPKSLSLDWYDASTRYSLLLPKGKAGTPLFEVASIAPGMNERMAGVARRERAERRTRFQQHQLATRLGRTWEKVQLGMSRAEVDDALPAGKGISRRALPDGLALIFKGVPEEHAGYIPRELFVRFGPNQKVAEIRVRYTDAPGTERTAGIARLLADLRQTGGAPEELPSPWQRIGTDLPARDPAPRRYRWQDDATRLTVERDSEGAELAALDCPVDQESGIQLPAFRCVGSGPKGCSLDQLKADLLKHWNQASSQVNKQGLAELTSPEDGPYDRLFVRFGADGRVEQVLALHKPVWDADPGDVQLAAAVRKAWAEKIEAFGWPRREDTTRRGLTQGWMSHDETARVRVFWQRSKSGRPQLVTEWRRVP